MSNKIIKVVDFWSTVSPHEMSKILDQEIKFYNSATWNLISQVFSKLWNLPIYMCKLLKFTYCKKSNVLFQLKPSKINSDTNQIALINV